MNCIFHMHLPRSAPLHRNLNILVTTIVYFVIDNRDWAKLSYAAYMLTPNTWYTLSNMPLTAAHKACIVCLINQYSRLLGEVLSDELPKVRMTLV